VQKSLLGVAANLRGKICRQAIDFGDDFCREFNCAVLDLARDRLDDRLECRRSDSVIHGALQVPEC
jgi:hypothetical protein